jgi:acetylornithine deacetylase/succinyl-diaminopimelate desuccinylase-like protein
MTIAPDAAALHEHRALHDHIDRHAAEYVEELRRFLRVPGFSDTGEGMAESATAGLDYLRLAGAMDAELVDTGGNPVIFGHTRSRAGSPKTLGVYSLYDMTPVVQDRWAVEPTGATIISPDRIGLPNKLGSLICSRATYNHRAPMLSFMFAVKAMLEVEGDIPVNLTWMWDGEEELGSPNFHVFMDTKAADLKQLDALHGPFMQQAAYGGPMVIYRGFKGALLFELACEGGEWGGTVDGRHGWSGNGPFVDAPMMKLVQALASLYDDDHRVVIDGVPETVLPLTEDDRSQIIGIRNMWTPELEELTKLVANVRQLRNGKSVPELIERWVADVGVNIQGIVGGYMGPTFYTMLPQKAAAKIDMRLPPGPTTTRVLELLRAHLDRRGFDQVQIKYARGYEGYRTPTDDPSIQSAIRAAAVHGVETSVWPTTNAFCPASLFSRPPFNLPSAWTGLGYGDRPHQPEEYVAVDSVRQYMHFAVTYLHEWAKAG